MPPSAARAGRGRAMPPRLMPTPSEPQPVPLHGGTKFGVGPTRVRASTSAPRSSNSATTSGCAFAHGEHERRLLELAVARIDGGAAVEQQRDGLDDARAHGRHQRGLADRRDGIHVGARIEQRRDDGRVAVLGREIERRHAVAIGGVRVGARLEQQVNRVEAVGARRPVQGRRAVDGARVDGRALIEQPADGDPVAALRRVAKASSHRRRSLNRTAGQPSRPHVDRIICPPELTCSPTLQRNPPVFMINNSSATVPSGTALSRLTPREAARDGPDPRSARGGGLRRSRDCE